MNTEIIQTLKFGLNGSAEDSQLSGWSSPENGYTWSDGSIALIGIGAPDAPFGFFLEVDWQPALRAPYLSRQIVIVEINSQIVGTFAIDRAGPFAFLCPPQRKSARRLIVGFRFQNAFRPCDFGSSPDRRNIALAFSAIRVLVLKQPWKITDGRPSCAKIGYSDIPGLKRQAEQITGVPLDELLHGFEMLVGNCDMGLALREFGFEKLSLLRFGGATVRTAIVGLEDDFAGIGETISLSVADNPMQEWMVRDSTGLLFHTGQSSQEVDRATVERTFPTYAAYLRRKLLEDLDEASKVFVFADHRVYGSARSVEDVLPLYLALRRRSGAKLLWVYPAAAEISAKGAVQEILPGLAIGQLDLTAPPVLVGGGITVSGWLAVLCNAWRVLHRAE